jgi:CysZ protein
MAMYEGFAAATGGIRFVLSTPRVWPFAAVPVVILLILTCALAGAGVWGAGQATGAILGEPESGWGQAGGWLLWLALVLAFGFIGLLIAMTLAQPLSGWALEIIALRQEEALLGRTSPQPPFLSGVLTGVRVAVVTLLAGGVLFVALFLVDLVFPPAVVVTIPLRFIAGAWLLAWDFLDYPLGLRGMGLRARFDWAMRHGRAFTAFGCFWALLMLVPGAFFFLLPLGVAGAARLVVMADVPAAVPEPGAR